MFEYLWNSSEFCIRMGFLSKCKTCVRVLPPWKVHQDLHHVQTDLPLLLAVGVFQLCKADLSRSLLCLANCTDQSGTLLHWKLKSAELSATVTETRVDCGD